MMRTHPHSLSMNKIRLAESSSNTEAGILIPKPGPITTVDILGVKSKFWTKMTVFRGFTW